MRTTRTMGSGRPRAWTKACSMVNGGHRGLCIWKALLGYGKDTHFSLSRSKPSEREPCGLSKTTEILLSMIETALGVAIVGSG